MSMVTQTTKVRYKGEKEDEAHLSPAWKRGCGKTPFFSPGDEGVVFIGWLHEYEFHGFLNSSTSSGVPSAESLDWDANGNER